MRIKIGRFEFTEFWDGVLYKNLSDYPNISDWELRSILDFMKYEADHGRSCTVEADEEIAEAIESCKSEYESVRRAPPPAKITECTACPKYRGCLTDFVCHTASPEDAASILDCGKLLSAVNARKKPASELKKEPRNAANDPEDYFDYVMFSWGNCQAGDRLVAERRLGRFPDKRDLDAPGFAPGARFMFRYVDLERHPSRVFDGVHPLKIKDEVDLRSLVYAIVIPENLKDMLEPHVPGDLADRTFYLESDGMDIWKWSETVYEFVAARKM